MARFGRNAPPANTPEPLHFAKYMTGVYPPAIVGVPRRPDWAAGAWSALNNIDGNDTLGDCCFAGIMHIVSTIIAATGMKRPFPSRAEAVALYSAVTGYDPNDPSTDRGADLPAVLNYIKQHGALPDGSFKPVGWCKVDAAQPIQEKTAIWAFGNLYSGLFLPSTGGQGGGGYTNPMPNASGFVWRTAGPPDMSEGHCIVKYGADDAGTFVDTWGMQGIMEYAADAQYLLPSANGENYAILFPEWEEQGKSQAPNGIDWVNLKSDLLLWPTA